MDISLQGLRRNLNGVREVLSRGALLSFAPEERDALLTDARRLEERLETIEGSFLTVGLLGGTGVGKSSLMNALAGSVIASTSHRRPHTERVLIYRHAAVEPPEALITSPVPKQEILHEAEAVRHIVLCDLPDFDSLVGEHRQRVILFLEHLDVLLWVVSPEKYADRRFYDFLAEVPKARANFLFVLNKVDILFEGRNLEVGYGELGKIMERFGRHLTENGVSHPLLYAASARDMRESAMPSPWNQFPMLRHHLFQHRDAREILAIKAANLDVEIRQFVGVLERELGQLEAFRGALHRVREEWEEERDEWAALGREMLDGWLKKEMDRIAFLKLAEPDALIGPGRLVSVAAREWERWTSRAPEGGLPGEIIPEDSGALAPLRRHLLRLEDRLANRLLSEGLPAVFRQEGEKLVGASGEWEDLRQHWARSLALGLDESRGRAGWGFRAAQMGVYGFLLLAFLMSLTGEESWQRWLQNPAWPDMLLVPVGMVRRLFGPEGLAGLISYVMLLFLAGGLFHGYYKKSLQGRARKLIEALGAQLEAVWMEHLKTVLGRLEACEEKVASQMTALSRFGKPSAGE